MQLSYLQVSAGYSDESMRTGCYGYQAAPYDDTVCLT